MDHTIQTQLAGIDFIKKSADIVSELSFEQLLYLSRDEKFLKEMLQKTPTDLIIAKGIESIVPSLEKISLKKAIGLRNPYARNDSNLVMAKNILESGFFHDQCFATDECTAVGYQLLCPLSTNEVVHILGKENVEAMTFSLAQVRHLAQEQNNTRRTGPLDFRKGNYFFLKGRNNNIRSIMLWWREGVRNRWHYWFSSDDKTDKLISAESTVICRHI